MIAQSSITASTPLGADMLAGGTCSEPGRPERKRATLRAKLTISLGTVQAMEKRVRGKIAHRGPARVAARVQLL